MKTLLPLLLLTVSVTLCSAADDQSAAMKAAEVRTFSTADGAYTVRAALVGVETDKTGGTVVVLRREAGGALIRVRLDKLCAEDVQFINSADNLLSVPIKLRGRLTAEARAALRTKAGSDAQKAESAVERSLGWLRTKQNPSGSWGSTYPPAMTGLVLMVFAGHGYGPGSVKHGQALTGGMKWLMELGGKNQGAFAGVLSEMPGTIVSAYQHPIATQGLAEMYALSERGKKAPEGLADVIGRAEEIIIKNQHKSGAWSYKDGLGYDSNPAGNNDLSLTGWQIHALRACRDAGLDNNKRAAALLKTTAYLKTCQTQEGGFGRNSRIEHYNQWNLTGSALTGLLEEGRKDRDAERGVTWLMKLTRAEPLQWTKECYLYTWYYNSLALHAAGGEA